MKDIKRIFDFIFSVLFICMLGVPMLVKADDVPIKIYIDEDNSDYLENGKNTDGTVTYDEANATLTLDNYIGDEITISLDTDLTIIIKGDNVINSDLDRCGIASKGEGNIKIIGDGSLHIKNAGDGIFVFGEKLEIDSGNIIVENIMDNAFNISGNFVFNDGNIEIITTGEEDVLCGIISMGSITINGGTIKMNVDQVGIYTSSEIIINDGKLIINAISYGIMSFDKLTLHGDYLEINTPDKNTSAAFVVVSNDEEDLDIATGLIMVPNDVSLQKVKIISDNMDVLTLGKTGATAELGSSLIDLVVSNIANSVKLYAPHTVSFDSNGGTGEMENINNLNGLYTLPENEFTAPKGKEFKGWSLSSNGAIITELDVNEDKVVYAIWETNYKYEFINGSNIELLYGKIDKLSFTIDGDYSLFESLKIGDLELIKEDDYNVTEGSTIITFTNSGIAKLNKLKNGKYEIIASYSNGKEASSILNIIDTVNPKTADPIFIYITLGVISVLGIIGLSLYSKKRMINK